MPNSNQPQPYSPLVFFGSSVMSVKVLNALIGHGIKIDFIVTTPDKPQGRKMIPTPTPTKVWAEENSIEYVEPIKLKDESFLNKIKNYNLFIVASYGKIIPKIVIDMPKFRILNIHPSLLPKYRGPSPIVTPILNGDKQTGYSIIKTSAGCDCGPIIAQKTILISPADTHTSLKNKILAQVKKDFIAEKQF